MNKSLLDTNILSDIIRNKRANVIQKSECYLSFYPQYTISNISIMEIIKGFIKISADERIKDFETRLQKIEIIYLDYSSTFLAAKILANLEKQGLTIELADLLIGSIAIAHELTLVTSNVKHFENIQKLGDKLGYDLEIDNWRD